MKGGTLTTTVVPRAAPAWGSAATEVDVGASTNRSFPFDTRLPHASPMPRRTALSSEIPGDAYLTTGRFCDAHTRAESATPRVRQWQTLAPVVVTIELTKLSIHNQKHVMCRIVDRTLFDAEGPRVPPHEIEMGSIDRIENLRATRLLFDALIACRAHSVSEMQRTRGADQTTPLAKSGKTG